MNLIDDFDALLDESGLDELDPEDALAVQDPHGWADDPAIPTPGFPTLPGGTCCPACGGARLSVSAESVLSFVDGAVVMAGMLTLKAGAVAVCQECGVSRPLAEWYPPVQAR